MRQWLSLLKPMVTLTTLLSGLREDVELRPRRPHRQSMRLHPRLRQAGEQQRPRMDLQDGTWLQRMVVAEGASCRQ